MGRVEQKKQRDRMILDKAEEAIVERGLFSLSLLELARQAECSVNTLYGSFAKREDIAVGLFNRVMATFGVKACQEIALRQESIAERFMAMQMIWIRRQHKQSDLGGVQFLAAMPSVWKHASHSRIAITRKLLDSWYQSNLNFLQMARANGELVADDDHLHQCLNEVTCVERGFSLFSNNYSFRDEAISLPMERVFKVMSFSLEELSWQTPLTNDSFKRVMNICDEVETSLRNFDVDEHIWAVEMNAQELQ
ncbi:TetR/AcrR family transcriptional regulator [Ferrimonas lipolytica]|uniref:TetR/AcrR family transcriptional regulator n=2 Tax=Ferrimonas lipolytica TaxID=2724191 RepID=A0A6H1UGA8_9GAMM|nr:TetR/AcrR family transcriptional regulator [Ferrimonas lipolytica]